MVSLGALGGLLLASVTGPLVRGLLSVPDLYQQEAVSCLRVVAVGMPLIVVAGGLSAVLAGYQKFPLINGLRIPFSALTNLGQVLVATLLPDLSLVVAVIIVVRVLNACVLLWFCRRLAPFPNAGQLWKRKQAVMLLRFGGWITVSNVIGPLMVYLDRFVIGAMLSMSAVAYYATPHEAVMRLGIVPSSIVGVLFPAFATVLQQDRQRVVRLFNSGMAANLLLLFPLTVFLVGFAEPLLDLWLGADFAVRSAPVLQIMAIGVLLNSVAYVPFALVQAAGRPDLTAKLHLAELIPYLALLMWWTEMWGIVGAALIWLVRAAFDTIVLTMLTRRLLPELGAQARLVWMIVVPCVAILFLLCLDLPVAVELMLMAIGILCGCFLIWMKLLTPEDRLLFWPPRFLKRKAQNQR